MSRTVNTDPWEVQQKDGHKPCSQRDMRVVSNIRRSENRAYRAKARQAMRNGRFDDIPARRKNAAWLTW